jgi:hypothetical protein
MVQTYTLHVAPDQTVVDPLDPETAVEPCGWARVRAALKE